MDTATVTLDLPDEQATADLGGRLAALARPGDVIALRGDLGTGKTALARGFVRSLCGPDEEVPSPTFTLVQMYEGEELTVWHFDLYRLHRAEDALELGIEDAFADGVSLIEWPDRLGRLLPAERLEVTLSRSASPNARRVQLSGSGSWAERIRQSRFHA